MTHNSLRLLMVMALTGVGIVVGYAGAWAQEEGALPVPGLYDQLGAQNALAGENAQAQAQAQAQTPLQPQPSQNNLSDAQTAEQQSAAQAALKAVQDEVGTADEATNPVIDRMLQQAAQEEAAQNQSARPGRMGQNNTQNVVQSQDGDALPDVRNVRLDVENMDYVSEGAVDLELRDIPDAVTNEEYQQSIRNDAFDAASTGLFPLRPDEIQEILRRYDETKKAVEAPHYDLPTPEVSVHTVSLDPGVTPPIIKTATGHVTTLTVLDITGAPWPIQDVSWAGDFEVIEPEEGGHIIRITPLGQFAYGNVSMRLLTLKTPITFTLRTQRDVVQYRFDARIPEYGPLAEAPLIEGGREIIAGNNDLTTILDGVAPQGAVKLAVSGVDGRTTAYKIGPTTYVRTPLTLLSPAWDNSVKSADGMNVYAMADTPVVLLSDQGKFMRATLREQESIFDGQ